MRRHNKSLHPIWPLGPAFACCSRGAANAGPMVQTGELNRYLSWRNMRSILMLVLPVVVSACTKPVPPTGIPTTVHTEAGIGGKQVSHEFPMLCESYSDMRIKQIPLGKCIALSHPKGSNNNSMQLDLFLNSLNESPRLISGDEIWIYMTPKNCLQSKHDFIKDNKSSKQNDNHFTLSFDYVNYMGGMRKSPDDMICLIAFNLGQLSAGKYKVSVVNDFFVYYERGHESKAGLIPKGEKNPDTFRYDIEFAVHDR